MLADALGGGLGGARHDRHSGRARRRAARMGAGAGARHRCGGGRRRRAGFRRRGLVVSLSVRARPRAGRRARGARARRGRDHLGGVSQRGTGAGVRLDVARARGRCHRPIAHRQRAGDRVPCPRAAADQAPPAGGPLADAGRQQRQPAVVPDDGVRQVAGVCCASGGRRPVAACPSQTTDAGRHRPRPGHDERQRRRVRGPCSRGLPRRGIRMSRWRRAASGRCCARPDRVCSRPSWRSVDAQRWWPHTHGTPALHQVVVRVGDETVATRRVGFRTLEYPQDIVQEGLKLAINGLPVFVRGAVWTPSDLVSLAPPERDLRELLERARDAGMNMLRLAGTGAYESTLFHDLCDELGILVWQDLMFANLDYPVVDEVFANRVLEEAREVLGRLAHRPSMAVVCGNNEIEQQPAMMGLDPELGRDPLWDRELGEIVAGCGLDCAYVREHAVRGRPAVPASRRGRSLLRRQRLHAPDRRRPSRRGRLCRREPGVRQRSRRGRRAGPPPALEARRPARRRDGVGHRRRLGLRRRARPLPERGLRSRSGPAAAL